LFILDLFAKKVSPQITEALLSAAEDPKYFPDVRFRALETLVAQKQAPKERLLKALSQLREEAPEKSTSRSLVTKDGIDRMIQKLSERP